MTLRNAYFNSERQQDTDYIVDLNYVKKSGFLKVTGRKYAKMLLLTMGINSDLFSVSLFFFVQICYENT